MTDPNALQADYWNSESGKVWLQIEGFMDTALAPVLARLLARLLISPGERVLDIGCGTGASTLAAAALAGPSGHVMGLDISAPLLDRARQRAQHVPGVGFVLADAQTYAFIPASHDAVLSRFGVMFFSDPEAAFANIASALLPGGRMVFAAWAPIEGNPWFKVPRDVAVDRLGRPAPSDPLAPGPLAFQDPDRVRGILRAAGLADVQVVTEELLLTPPGSLAEVAKTVTRVGPASRIIAERAGTEADAQAIINGVMQEFAGFAVAGALALPATIHLVSASHSGPGRS